MRSFCLYILIFITAIQVLACSSSNPDEPKEVKPSEDETVRTDTPEDKLLDDAQELYSSGLFTVARDSFQSLQMSYPVGAYAEYAQIKVADCSFLAREYDIAAGQYENFIKDHPVHSANPYITFKIGLSHYLHNKGSGRDITPLEQALIYFNKTVTQYPNTTYAKVAKDYIKKTEKKLASHNKLVSQFYDNLGYKDASIDRLEEDKAKKNTNQKISNNKPITSDLNNPAIKLSLHTVSCSNSTKPTISLIFDDSNATTMGLKTFVSENYLIESNAGVTNINLTNVVSDSLEFQCDSNTTIKIIGSKMISIINDKTKDILGYSVIRFESPNKLLLIPK
jgi:outer membrane assembly lipoprotein YfiO